jgi:hypothetical protein
MPRAARQAKRQNPADEQQKRRGGGGKLARSEVVTVRLDPKLRYLAELAARKQRRTLSSFIEWAVEDVLKRVTLSSGPDGVPDTAVEREAHRLWSVDGKERFVRLAILHPDLMTYEDQQVWSLLQESFLLTPARSRSKEGKIEWDWAELEDRVLPTIRECWPDLMMAALGTTLEKRQWIERTQAEVAHGKVYSDIMAKKANE